MPNVFTHILDDNLNHIVWAIPLGAGGRLNSLQRQTTVKRFLDWKSLPTFHDVPTQKKKMGSAFASKNKLEQIRC